MHAELIITATEQQARSLRRLANQAARDQGNEVWAAAQIISLDRYVRDTWLQSWPAELLLSPAQELLLWQQCLKFQEEHSGLISNRQLARLLQSSYQRATRWQIDWRPAPHWTPEQQFFAQTARRFERALVDRASLAACQLPQRVAEGLDSGVLQPPSHIQFHSGGAALDAASLTVLDAMQRAGCNITAHATPSAAAPTTHSLCADETSLWQSIALSIRAQLVAKPQARIVVAVPRLNEGLLQRIDSIWHQQLAPELLASSNPQLRPLWAYERSGALADQTAVAAALLALRPQSRDNRFEDISAFLLNPLLFRGEDAWCCAQAEVVLREDGARVDLRQVLFHLPASTDESLRTRLQDYAEVLHHAPSRGSCLAWLEHWQQLWEALNYLTSGDAWPLREEFDQALLEFAGLNDSLGAVDASNALAWLTHIAQQQRFQESSARLAPVRVCDLETALGTVADRYIVANMDNRSLPLAAQVDPFLRIDDQISSGMPTASPALRLAQARDYIQRFQSQAAPVDFYCALSNSEGAHSEPSALIAGPWQECAAVQATPASAPSQAQPRADDPVPPLDAARQAGQRSAVSVVQAQAHGSFFAFARHRLGVRALPTVQQGLSASAQGLWIHAALQSFWTAHRKRAALLALSPEQLLEDVRTRIAALADRYVPQARHGAPLQQAEADRVLRCCVDWLNHERRRVDDFTVLHCEADLQETLGPFEFRMRIDRIDLCHTPQGPRYLVIDYKTGSRVETKYWKTHQFYEPQLPLYACSARLLDLDIPQVDGICFAHVAEGQPAFVASVNWCKKLIVEDTKPFHTDWEGTLDEWRVRLHELVQAYCAGGAAYSPQIDYSSRYAVNDLLELIDVDASEEYDGDGDEQDDDSDD